QPVVVIVTPGEAVGPAPTLGRQTGAGGDVGERGVVVVVEQLGAWQGSSRAAIVEVADDQVRVAVVVVVGPGHGVADPADVLHARRRGGIAEDTVAVVVPQPRVAAV